MLRKLGSRHSGLCPFHADTSPSFYVFPDNHYKCFGCGEHGDAMNFIMKLRGLDWSGALNYLRIEPAKRSKQAICRRNHKTKIISDYKDWLAKADIVLEIGISHINDILAGIKTADDFFELGGLFNSRELFQYWRDILFAGSDEDKFKLYQTERWIHERI